MNSQIEALSSPSLKMFHRGIYVIYSNDFTSVIPTEKQFKKKRIVLAEGSMW